MQLSDWSVGLPVSYMVDLTLFISCSDAESEPIMTYADDINLSSAVKCLARTVLGGDGAGGVSGQRSSGLAFWVNSWRVSAQPLKTAAAGHGRRLGRFSSGFFVRCS